MERLSLLSPYTVHDVHTVDIKVYVYQCVNQGMLHCGLAKHSTEIQWTNVCQFKITKATPNSFFFKLSHDQNEFS